MKRIYSKKYKKNWSVSKSTKIKENIIGILLTKVPKKLLKKVKSLQAVNSLKKVIKIAQKIMYCFFLQSEIFITKAVV